MKTSDFSPPSTTRSKPSSAKHSFSAAPQLHSPPLLEATRFEILGCFRLCASLVSPMKRQGLTFHPENRKETVLLRNPRRSAPGGKRPHHYDRVRAGDSFYTPGGGATTSCGESWYPTLNGFGEKALTISLSKPEDNVVINSCWQGSTAIQPKKVLPFPHLGTPLALYRCRLQLPANIRRWISPGRHHHSSR